MNNKVFSFGIGLAFGALAASQPALASVESSLTGIKTALQSVILPTLAVMGVLFAGASLMFGHPNAKHHISYAVIGAVVAFGAQAIVDWLSHLVR